MKSARARWGVVRSWRRVMRAVRARRPRAALLVNYTEYNSRLAPRLQAEGVRVLWYGAPQVWAWRPGRTTSLRTCVDRMAVMLPFEEAIWRAAGVDAHYVGHPALETEALAARNRPRDARDDAVRRSDRDPPGQPPARGAPPPAPDARGLRARPLRPGEHRRPRAARAEPRRGDAPLGPRRVRLGARRSGRRRPALRRDARSRARSTSRSARRGRRRSRPRSPGPFPSSLTASA